MRPNLIAGEWVEGSTTVVNRSPSDLSDVVDEFAVADEAQVDAAIEAAAGAAPVWAAATPMERSTVLETAGLELAARADELGEQLAREEGKPRAEAVGEVQRASQIFRFFAGEALRVAGEHQRSVRPGVDVDVLREPLGVVGIITPWNFPIAIPAWKVAPALAYGCTVVFKPAELVPASAWSMVDAIARAGAPPGVCNLVVGPGSVVGERLVHDPRVRGVSFTGSQAVGAGVAAGLAARFGRSQLEMGGKNPLVVLDDADLPTAVSVAVNGAFFQAGQRCTASSRIIVTEGIHDRFIDAMIARMKTLVIDDALKAGTEIGPVVDQRQLDKNLEYVEIGRKEGARLAHGGGLLKRDTDGYYMAPALFADSAPGMRINSEEIFGPVAAVIRVRDYDEALATANATPFGLSAGIVTTSLKYASHFKRNSESGLVMVNLPTAGLDYHVPFGGRKKSSYGPREQGAYAREFYTIVKTAYVAP